jgi:hypothetical protein
MMGNSCSAKNRIELVGFQTGLKECQTNIHGKAPSEIDVLSLEPVV